MYKHNLNGISFTFENLNSNSYLTVKMDERYSVIEHQVEMIANNRCWGILEFDMRIKNNNTYLYCNITSKIDIVQFLKRKKLKKDEFLMILESITNTLLESKSYFLSDKNFIMQKEYMFINPTTLEVFLVFLPVSLEGDTAKNLKDFILDIITTTAVFDEESVNDNFLQKILNCVKMETFNATEIGKLIKEIRMPKCKGNTSLTNPATAINKPTEKKIVFSEVAAPPAENSRDIDIGVLPKSNTAVQIPKSNAKNLPKTETEPPLKKFSFMENKKTLGTVLLLQLIFLTVAFTVFCSFKNEDISFYIGILVLLGAIDAFAVKKLFSMKKPAQKVEDSIASSDPTRLKTKVPIPKSSKSDTSKVEHSSRYSIQDLYTNYIDNAGRTPENIEIPRNDGGNNVATIPCPTNILAGKNIKETCILDTRSDAKKVLILKGFEGEEIAVTKDEFLVGRLKEQVDYVVSNDTVGKVHAALISREGEFFVKDLNSRNGTYINGQRIDSNKEYKVNIGDKLSFSNSHYTLALK